MVADGQLPTAERYLDRASIAAPLAGVLEEVPDRPLHSVAIADHDGWLNAQCLPRDGRKAGARTLDRVLDDMVELEGAALGLSTASKLEETPDEGAHLLRLAVEVVEELEPLLRAELDVAAEHVDVRLET